VSGFTLKTGTFSYHRKGCRNLASPPQRQPVCDIFGSNSSAFDTQCKDILKLALLKHSKRSARSNGSTHGSSAKCGGRNSREHSKREWKRLIDLVVENRLFKTRSSKSFTLHVTIGAGSPAASAVTFSTVSDSASAGIT